MTQKMEIFNAAKKRIAGEYAINKNDLRFIAELTLFASCMEAFIVANGLYPDYCEHITEMQIELDELELSEKSSEKKRQG